MLGRLIDHYEHKRIYFEDIYYNNRYIFHRHSLKNRFLQRSKYISTYAGLKQIENMIIEKVREENKERLRNLEDFVSKYPEHVFQIKPYARLISLKETRKLVSNIRKFTEIDYFKLYYEMFSNKELFYILADINQTIEKQTELNFYEEIQRILDIKAATLYCFYKGFA